MNQGSPNLADSVRDQLESRKEWERPIHPMVSVIDPSKPLAAGFLAFRQAAIKAPAVVLQLVAGLPSPVANVEAALYAETMCTDVDATAHYAEATVDRILTNPKYREHALRVSILSGNIPNALSIFRRIIDREGEVPTETSTYTRLGIALRDLAGDPQLTTGDLNYLSVLSAFIEQGGRFGTRHRPERGLARSADYGDFVRSTVERFGARSKDVLLVFKEETFSAHRATVERIVELSSDRLPQLSCCLLARSGHVDLADVLILHEQWGPEAWGFIRAHGDRAKVVAEEFAPLFKRILETLRKDECEDDFGVAVGAVPETVLRDAPDAVDAVVRHAGPYQHHSLCGIGRGAYRLISSGAIAAIAKETLYYAEAAFNEVAEYADELSIPEDSVRQREFSEFIQAVASHTATTLPDFLKCLTPSRYQGDPRAARVFAEQHGRMAAGLLRAHPDDPVSSIVVEKDRLRRIRNLFGENAASFVSEAAVSVELDHAFERWGKSAGFVYRAFGADFDKGLSPAEEWIINENRREFGLVALHRYAQKRGDQLNLKVLRMNLENLDPTRRPHEPIALIVFGRDCHNDALANHGRDLARLSRSYKLYVAEVESTEELRAIIERVGSLHGLSHDGTPSRPIELLAIHTHGYRDFLRWREIESLRRTDRSPSGPLLVAEHKESLASALRMMAPKSLGILSSCEGGFGGADASNPLTWLSESAPHATWEGARRSTSQLGYRFDETGKVLGARYSCSTRKVVVI